jgi:Protein of unknown function (DUF3040)
MPLSEYEQRVLEQMERQLTSDDPRLANTLQSRGSSRRGVGRWFLVGAGFIGGLLLLVAGAAMSQLWLGVIGFLLMFGAVAYAFAGPQTSGPAGVVRGDGSVAPRNRGAKKPAARAGFMARLEERWDRRRHEGR